jgi:hypothetical protein
VERGKRIRTTRSGFVLVRLPRSTALRSQGQPFFKHYI